MSLLGFFRLLCSCCSIYSLNCLTFCLAWAATGTLGVGCTQPSLIVCDSHTTSCSLWLNFMPSEGLQQPQLPLDDKKPALAPSGLPRKQQGHGFTQPPNPFA